MNKITQGWFDDIIRTLRKRSNISYNFQNLVPLFCIITKNGEFKSQKNLKHVILYQKKILLPIVWLLTQDKPLLSK